MKHIAKPITLLAALCLAAAPAFAKEKDKEKGAAKVSAMDKCWAETAAVSDAMELTLAKAAQQKGESQQVKDHAQQMLTDHGKTSAELKQWAKANSVALKDQLPPEKQAVVEEIRGKSGADFDQAYLSHEIAHHRMAVAHFHNGEFLKEPQLQAFAQQNLPTIEGHLAMVEKNGQHGGAGVTSSGGSSAGGANGAGGSSAGGGSSGGAGAAHSSTAGAGAGGASGGHSAGAGHSAAGGSNAGAGSNASGGNAGGASNAGGGNAKAQAQ